MVKSASKAIKSNVIADIKVPVPSLTVETQTAKHIKQRWTHQGHDLVILSTLCKTSEM